MKKCTQEEIVVKLDALIKTINLKTEIEDKASILINAAFTDTFEDADNKMFQFKKSYKEDIKSLIADESILTLMGRYLNKATDFGMNGKDKCCEKSFKAYMEKLEKVQKLEYL